MKNKKHKWVILDCIVKHYDSNSYSNNTYISNSQGIIFSVEDVYKGIKPLLENYLISYNKKSNSIFVQEIDNNKKAVSEIKELNCNKSIIAFVNKHLADDFKLLHMKVKYIVHQNFNFKNKRECKKYIKNNKNLFSYNAIPCKIENPLIYNETLGVF